MGNLNKKAVLLFLFLLSFCVAASCLDGSVKAQTVYTYTFHGPYYEDGGVANANVTVAIQWVNGSVLRFTMVGDGSTANTTTFTSTQPAFEMLWNASSALNLTRVLDFMGETTEEYNIYIPSPQVPAGTYTFSVTDLAGVTNPFLETSLSTNGSSYYVVERRSLNFSGTVTFTMAQYGTYTLAVHCNLGTYTQTFTAENVFYYDIPLLAGVFPSANSTIPVVTAQRLNSSLIGVSYVDPSNLTSSFYFNITHRNGLATIFDYSYTSSSSSGTFLWNLASSSRAYKVTAVATISGTTKTWIIQIPTEAPANPWLGAFDFLGNYTATLPHVPTGWEGPGGTQLTSGQIAQLVAAAIITLFLSIGSFKSAGACCVVAWAISGIMLYLGWFQGGTAAASIPTFALAGVLSAFLVISEYRESTGAV